jgi:hypothetical protein
VSTTRVDLAQLAEWSRQVVQAQTPLEQSLALSNLLVAGIRMSMELEALETKPQAPVLELVREVTP